MRLAPAPKAAVEVVVVADTVAEDEVVVADDATR
jgi:hypothetical protein